MHPVEPRTFGGLLSDSFAILKRNSGLISRTILFFWIVPLVPVLLITFSLIRQWPQDIDFENLNEDSLSPEFAGLMLSALFCVAVFALFAVIGYIVMVGIAVCDREDEAPTLKELLAPIIRRNLWWVILIYVCAVIAGELVSSPFTAEGEPLGGMTYILVSTVINSILGMKTYLTVPVLSLEDRGPIKAVERSWKLTNGHFWQTMGRYFAISVTGGAAVMIPFMFGLVATTMVVKGSGADNILTAMQDLGTMLTIFLLFLPSFIISMLVLVIEPIYRSEVFYDLRQRKGEFDELIALP
jgi:membrane-anchored glycerophosphoryl diester phosphodiesterase (GDPDase)